MAKDLPDLDKIPLPHNMEAEQALLGAIVMNNDVYTKVSGVLRAEHFYEAVHREIYEVIEHLIGERKVANPVTMRDHMAEIQVEDMTGPQYLAMLAAGAMPFNIAMDYANLIVEDATKRALFQHFTQKREELLRNKALKVSDVIDDGEIFFADVRPKSDRAEQFVPFSRAVDEASDIANMAYGRGGVLSGMATGLDKFDDKLGGLGKSDLIILAARPAMGKTSLAINITFRVALDLREMQLDGEKPGVVAFFSLEMPRNQVAARIMAESSKISSYKIKKGSVSEAQLTDFLEAGRKLSNLPIYIDHTGALPINQLITRIRALKKRLGVALIVVDYIQLLRGSKQGKEINRVQELHEITTSLKSIAKELDVPVIALSQLSRKVEERDDKRPKLADLRESGCLAGDTLVLDPGTGIHRSIADMVGYEPGFALALDGPRLHEHAISRGFSTGVKPVHRMTLQGGQAIKATGNHKFLTQRGWQRLDKIGAGDYVATPRHIPMASGMTEVMSESEIILAAHLIGDGCLLPSHAVQYTSGEREMADIVAAAAVGVFGDKIAPRVQQERTWFQTYLPASFPLTHGRRNPIGEWAEKHGLWGKRSYEKTIPELVFGQRTKLIELFIRHLWATDGHIGFRGGTAPGPTIFYSSASENLSRGLKHLLLRVGVIATVTRAPQTKGRDQWVVRVSGHKDQAAFMTAIGALGEHRQAAAERIHSYLLSKGPNPNRDNVPGALWRPIADRIMVDEKITPKEVSELIGLKYSRPADYQNISRAMLDRIATALDSDELFRIARSDICWERVVSIEPAGEEEVFDLTVPGPANFVANDIICHNSIEQDADSVVMIYRDEYYLKSSEPRPGTEQHNDWTNRMERARGRASLIIEKNRHGPTGSVDVGYNDILTQFHNDVPENVASNEAPKERRERKKAIKLSSDAMVGLKRLNSMQITVGVENDSLVGTAPKGAKLVSYLAWKKRVSEELLDPEHSEKQATALLEKITKELTAADLIARGGSKLEPFVWPIPEKK